MKVAIIISKHHADRNILSNLENFRDSGERFNGKPVLCYKNMSIYEIEGSCLDYDHMDKDIEADLFIFATRHQSETQKPCLTCHTPGNWGKAEAGGKDKMLCTSPSYYLKRFFLELKKYNVGDAEVTLEVTHHGPYLEKPCMFVEIGSSEREWKNEEYGRIIAECITNVFSKEEEEIESCILLGGGHYNQYGNKLMERTEFGVGHICPKYMLEELDKETLRQAFYKTSPLPKIVLLDWKGLGRSKDKVVKLLEEEGYKYEKVKKVIKNGTI